MTCSAILAGLAPARRSGAALVATLTLALLPGFSQAGACGDNIHGERVACSCGDQVVADVVLQQDDPVVLGPCSGDGLLIKLPTGVDGITINLGGHRISGNGGGTGIRVVDGGRLGSVIVGGTDGARGEITGFRTGISAHGTAVLREVRGLDVRGNRSDGLRMRSNDVLVIDVNSEGNGGDGMAVSGRDVEVADVTASDNVGDGVRVRGSGVKVAAETMGNLGNGAVVSGRNSRADAVRSTNNGGVGLITSGSGSEVGRVHAQENARGNVAVRKGDAK
ncbi:MAG: hypothetical protein ABR587_16345 [Candidatus Binatia bacterium]